MGVKKSILVPALVLIGLSGVAYTNGVFGAGSATLSLAPASGNQTVNTNFTVDITENSGSEAVNAVDVNLSYDQAKLQFISVSTSGSPFTTCTPAPSGGAGSIHIVCIRLAGTVTGSQPVGTVTFKALSQTGTTAVTFNANSHIVSSPAVSDIWNGSTAGATYTLVSPPAAPSTSTTTTTPTTVNSTNTATNPSAAKKTTPTKTTTTAPSVNTPAAVGDTIQATSTGNLIAIRVVSASGTPVQNAKVTISDLTVVTDATGVASFVNIPAGDYQVLTESDGNTITTTVTVKNATNEGEVQQFEVQLNATRNMVLYAGIGAGVILLVVAAAVVMKKFKKSKRSLSTHKNTTTNQLADTAYLGDRTPPPPAGNISPSIDSVPNADIPQPSTIIKPSVLETNTSDSSYDQESK